jgi:hypothetical protein
MNDDSKPKYWNIVWDAGSVGWATKLPVDNRLKIKGQDQKHYLVGKIRAVLMPDGHKASMQICVLQDVYSPAERLQEIEDMIERIPGVHKNKVINNGSKFSFNFDVISKDHFHQASIEVMRFLLKELGIEDKDGEKSMKFSEALENIRAENGILIS